VRNKPFCCPFCSIAQLLATELQQVLISTLPEKFPEKPQNPFRRLLWKFVTSKAFTYGIAVIIILNVIILCMNWYHTTGIVDEWVLLQRYADYIFTIIYVIEFIMKLIAFGFRGYFKDGWNILDFIIVIISVVGMVGSFIPSFATITNLMKAFRVARTLRLLKITKYFKRLRILFKTAVYASILFSPCLRLPHFLVQIIYTRLV